MHITKGRCIAIITLALFMLGLFNINGLKPGLANDYGVDISFAGLEGKVLSGDIEFNVNSKVAANSSINKEWPLRYKLEIINLLDNKPVVGQTVYYGENLELDFKTLAAGTIFLPQDNFSVETLTTTAGISTKFSTNLSPGDYQLKLSLIRINETGVQVEILGERLTSVTASDVIYTISQLEGELPPGEIPFTITCRVSESVADNVYLRHKATIYRNSLPLAGQLIQYKEADNWRELKSNDYGIAYFGPETGFTLAQLPELKATGGITTELKTALAIGEYRIKVQLVKITLDGEEDIGKDTERSFTVQRYPTLESKYPTPETTGLTNTNLSPQTIDGVTRYFIRLTYKLDGDLRLSSGAFNLLRSCTVHSAGGSLANIIDIDFLNIVENQEGYASKYIFVKEGAAVHLYIPVKPLRPQTSYQVNIVDNILYYYGGNDLDGSGNKAESWSFNTMAVPTVTGISLGSVGENYDIYQPIIIGGSYFDNDSITVKFNDTLAYQVKVHDNDGKPYLEVFLPRSRDRLKPGLYNITVLKNNNPEYSQTLYGSFSVVKASDLPVPQDGVRVTTDRIGDVIQSVKTSSATLLLKSSAANQGYLYLDLDKLMGEQVVARSIKLPNDGRAITTLNTISKFANVNVYNLRADMYAGGSDDLLLRLGRVESTLLPALQRNMLSSAIKSEFIEVDGENIAFDKVEIEMNYFNSDGQRIRVLRYDETYRQWFEQPFTKDLLNRQVNLVTDKAGIFVVVE